MSEQDSSPTRDVAELMRAVYATHPKLIVDVSLRHSGQFGQFDMASVMVLGLPAHFGDLDETRDGCHIWTSGISGPYGIQLHASRYEDDNLAAALTATLDFINARMAVAS